MTQYLPPNLLALFAPRDPIPYLAPAAKLPFEKKTRGYAGVASFINLFEDPKDTPAPVKIESREEKIARKKREKAELAAYKLEQGIALWDPKNMSNATKDPFKTIFVGKINFDTTESKLKREFETYGPIRKVHMVHDKVTGKPRGYAFIEYEHEKDSAVACKHGDGKKIDGRRVTVDVERGRTVSGWLPRRLGGGLGGRITRPERSERVGNSLSQDRESAPTGTTRPFRDRGDESNYRPRRRERDESNGGGMRDRIDREDRGYRDRDRSDRGGRDRGDRDRGDRDKKRSERSRSGSRDRTRDRKDSRGERVSARDRVGTKRPAPVDY